MVDRDVRRPTPRRTDGLAIAATLREQLAAERLRQPHGAELCFGLAPGRPFRVDRLQQRADEAWKGAGLPRLTLHDCRHTFASFAIAAGVNAKALSSYRGHSSVAITLGRYGHLMPGSEAEGTTLPLRSQAAPVASAIEPLLTELEIAAALRVTDRTVRRFLGGPTASRARLGPPALGTRSRVPRELGYEAPVTQQKGVRMTDDQERHPRDQESGGDEHEELSGGEEGAAAEPERGDEAQDPEGEAIQSDRGE